MQIKRKIEINEFFIFFTANNKTNLTVLYSQRYFQKFHFASVLLAIIILSYTVQYFIKTGTHFYL